MTRDYPDLGNTGWKFAPSTAEALPRFSFQGRKLKVFFAIRANIARRAKILTEVKEKGADSSRVFSYHFKLNGCGRLFRELNERDDRKEAERLDRNRPSRFVLWCFVVTVYLPPQTLPSFLRLISVQLLPGPNQNPSKPPAANFAILERQYFAAFYFRVFTQKKDQ